MRKCEHCDGLGCQNSYEDECMIQAVKEYRHLLYDNGGRNYGCRLTNYQYGAIYDLLGDLEHRHAVLITDYTNEGGIVWREPTQQETKAWSKQDKQWDRWVKKLSKGGATTPQPTPNGGLLGIEGEGL